MSKESLAEVDREVEAVGNLAAYLGELADKVLQNGKEKWLKPEEVAKEASKHNICLHCPEGRVPDENIAGLVHWYCAMMPGARKGDSWMRGYLIKDGDSSSLMLRLYKEHKHTTRDGEKLKDKRKLKDSYSI
jgi:hypothetical protein